MQLKNPTSLERWRYRHKIPACVLCDLTCPFKNHALCIFFSRGETLILNRQFLHALYMISDLPAPPPPTPLDVQYTSAVRLLRRIGPTDRILDSYTCITVSCIMYHISHEWSCLLEKRFITRNMSFDRQIMLWKSCHKQIHNTLYRCVHVRWFSPSAHLHYIGCNQTLSSVRSHLVRWTYLWRISVAVTIQGLTPRKIQTTPRCQRSFYPVICPAKGRRPCVPPSVSLRHACSLRPPGQPQVTVRRPVTPRCLLKTAREAMTPADLCRLFNVAGVCKLFR